MRKAALKQAAETCEDKEIQSNPKEKLRGFSSKMAARRTKRGERTAKKISHDKKIIGE